jgi:hypothetical protein
MQQQVEVEVLEQQAGLHHQQGQELVEMEFIKSLGLETITTLPVFLGLLTPILQF